MILALSCHLRNVVISLSDGEIANWSKVAYVSGGSGGEKTSVGLIGLMRRKEVPPIYSAVYNITRRNQVSHIQLGHGLFEPELTENMCNDLERWGAEVNWVTKPMELSQLIIRVAAARMKQYL